VTLGTVVVERDTPLLGGGDTLERIDPLPAHFIVIAGSAGAQQPLRQLVRALGPELDAAVLVSIHHPPNKPTALAHILERETSLPVCVGIQGQPLRAGHIYVAPPGYHHVLVKNGRIHIRPEPRHMRRCVSADPLFHSAAAEFGNRTIGVLLSGANRNGAAGLRLIREAGGQALAQDPAEAAFSTMPLAGVEAGVDLCAGAEALGRYIAERCRKR
jgi:two-component system chemotaxis response regulator CheB